MVTPAPAAIGFSSSSAAISPNGTGSKVTMRTNPVSASSWSSQTLVTSVCQRLNQNIKVSVSPRLQKCCPGESRSWLGHCGNQASLGVRMEKQLGTPDSHDLSCEPVHCAQGTGPLIRLTASALYFPHSPPVLARLNC